MFNNVPFRHSLDFFGQTITLETGLLAPQATASVLATMGHTTLLVAVVVGKPTTFDFLPLQVIYEEKLYAAGKIKGSRFIKREGRPTDNAVLTGRLIDRSLRSLFDDTIRNDIQVIITVLSVDEVNPPDTLGVVAASAALCLAGVQGFKGPVSCVRVGLSKARDHLMINPTYAQLKDSELDLIVSGTDTSVVMLEAGANIVPEEYITHAIESAMPAIKDLVKFQNDFIALCPSKITATESTTEDPLSTQVASLIKDELEGAMYASTIKQVKHDTINSIKKSLYDAVSAHLTPKPDQTPGPLFVQVSELIPNTLKLDVFSKQLHQALEALQKSIVERNVIEHQKRLDGRSLSQVRPLDIQVDVLPMVHGSSMFQRGETQVVNILTLGTLRDAQTLDDMEDFEETTKRYIHHYNFPPYSVGETGRYSGPGRREIGHGALAEKALVPVLPTEADFPYTMRLVSECLGSNGSSSMASTCASSLALMAGGVPITSPVAGIAMGVVVSGSRHAVLTDIQGEEDHLGDMDFKVTGTKDGVTAIQMDNKSAGLTITILAEALLASRTARHSILEQMNAVISTPKTNIATSAPKVTSIMIPMQKVGDVIGPQGKIIKSIIAQTGVEIDIEDETGRALIYAKDTESASKALKIIQDLIHEYQPGDIVSGTVFRIEDYGAFIKFAGEQEGMVHISRMSTERTERVEDKVKLGDTVTTYVVEINDKGQIALSLVPLDKLPAREARPPRSHSDRGDRPHRPRNY